MIAHAAELRRVPHLADHQNGHERQRDEHRDSALCRLRQQQGARGSQRRGDDADLLDRRGYRERSVHIRLVALATSGLSDSDAGHWFVPTRMTTPLPSV